MNPKEDPRFPIIALKGLPITIAALLCKIELPVTQTRLCDLLDSTDKTMSKALHRLEEFQILSHSEEGWSVTIHVTLLGLSLPEWLQLPSEPDEPVDKPVEKGRKFSDSSAPSSTSSIKLTNLKPEKNQLLEQLDPEPEPKKAPEPKTGPKPKKAPEAETEPKSAETIEECYEIALAAGIWEDRARKIAEMPLVTPQYIEDHIKVVQAEGREIQLAAYRIEQKWEVRWPKGMGGQNQKSQDLHECRKYVTGKYAAWVHH